MTILPSFDAPRGVIRDLQQLLAQTYRTVVVLSTGSIVAAGYLRVQRQARRLPPSAADALWERQHRSSARRLAKMATRLRGMLVKSGQYMSARPDLLPEAYIEELAGLQDAVSPRPFRLIAAQIRREFDVPVDELFAAFDRRPVASASLAQVHRATLRDGGTVAVKVLYPGIEGIVRADLRNLGLIVNLVGRIWPRYDFRVIYREVQRLVPIELDLRHEADNARRIGADLATRTDVLVPVIFPEYSRRRVLTMQFIDGIKVNDVAALAAAAIDPTVVARQIVDLFGDQVIGHGFFHGDPHPGNIFVMRDGRIALLDFGQALALQPDIRLGFALLSHAAATRDPAGMLRAIGMVGIHLPEADMASYMQMAARMVGATFSADATATPEDEGAAANVRMARSFRGISLDGITGEALFVFRVQSMLRGLRSQLGSPGNVILTWHGYVERLLDETESRQRVS